MIQDVLKDENIIINAEAKNWVDLINIVAQPLVEKEVITKGYVQSMINSVKELGPYIVIGKNIALAHARPEDGANKLGLSVVTVKNPIKFGHSENDPVKIIFCLSAIDSFSHLNIMKHLVELLNDGDKVKRLIEVQTKDEIKDLLF